MDVAIRLGEEQWKIDVTYFFHYPRDLRLIPSDNIYFKEIYFKCNTLCFCILKKISSRSSEDIESICEFVA